MILQVETPECWGHNFHVIALGTGRVPQIKKGVEKYLLAVTTISYYFKVSYFFERKFSDERQAKLSKMLDLKLTANSYWKFQPKMTTMLFWNSFCSNRPLPSSKNSRFQNETKCKTFLVKIRFI